MFDEDGYVDTDLIEYYYESKRGAVDRGNESVRRREEKERKEREALLTKYPYLTDEDIEGINNPFQGERSEWEIEEDYKRANALRIQEYFN